jgi:hypothetical protein
MGIAAQRSSAVVSYEGNSNKSSCGSIFTHIRAPSYFLNWKFLGNNILSDATPHLLKFENPLTRYQYFSLLDFYQFHYNTHFLKY